MCYSQPRFIRPPLTLDSLIALGLLPVALIPTALIVGSLSGFARRSFHVSRAAKSPDAGHQ
jgi:hypothetical protein